MLKTNRTDTHAYMPMSKSNRTDTHAYTPMSTVYHLPKGIKPKTIDTFIEQRQKVFSQIIFVVKVCTIQKKPSSLPTVFEEKSTINNYISINILSLEFTTDF